MLKLLEPEWPAPALIVAGTTERGGGVSEGHYASLNLAAHVGDAPQAVRENRRRLQRSAKLPALPGWLHQVHGVRVVEAAADSSPPQADAVFTLAADAVCAVLTADCLPVLFSSADGRIVAAAHAGWRGLAAGVLDRLIETLPANPNDLLVWLGPAISAPAYEVGDEVRQTFVGENESLAGCFTRNSVGRWQADLYGLARARLRRIGVTAIYGGDHCTASEPDRFFSYRRDGQCGRMATFIYRRSRT